MGIKSPLILFKHVYVSLWENFSSLMLWMVLKNIRHSHISHNAPYLLLQILHNLCFSFLLRNFFFFWGGGGEQIRCIMGVVQVANYKDLTTCEFNLLPSPLPHTPQLDYPRFEVIGGSLIGSLTKKMATSIETYRSCKEEISNSDCSASNYIKQPHQNRRMHLHMKIKERKRSRIWEDFRLTFCLHKTLTDLGSAQKKLSIQLFYNVFKKDSEEEIVSRKTFTFPVCRC